MHNVDRIIAQAHHRNGIGGAGVVMSLFTVKDEPGTFIAMSIRPDRPENEVYVRPNESTRDAYIRHWIDDFATHTAVLNIEETVKGNIAFAKGNSWRGADHYGPELAEAWREHQRTDSTLGFDPALERYENEHVAPDLEAQDRESYSDVQDRESYSTESV